MITLDNLKWESISYNTDEECFESLFERFKKEYPTTDLYYVDYRDEISSSSLQEYIHAWVMEDLYDNWDLFETFDYMYKEVFSKEEIDWLIETDYIEQVRQYCYDVDKSNLERDLLKNTREKQCYYYTWLSVSESWRDLNFNLRQLWLKIRNNESWIKELREWNYYWWELQILFKPDWEELFDHIYHNDDWTSYIIFEDPCIWLCDTMQWSGWFADFIWTIKLPFSKENVFICWEWPWYDLCQVYWTNDLWDSKYSFKKARKKLKVEVDPMVEQYSKWDKDLKKWICHSDDPRRNSHKYSYRNDYPCWWTCSRCQKFIID